MAVFRGNVFFNWSKAMQDAAKKRFMCDLQALNKLQLYKQWIEA